MSRANKTGGGPGTNQYKVRGQAKRRPKAAYGYTSDQVIKRGDCVWPRAGVDGLWCLVHRQLAPELRQLMSLPMCVDRLGLKLQEAALATMPINVAQQWCIQSANPIIRRAAASQMPPDQLAWATTDEDAQVRQVAAARMPLEQLQWVVHDPDTDVRLRAAERMPDGQLQWATKDEDWGVRWVAAQRMPEDQLDWATRDPDRRVRRIAAERMPPDQLQWAAQDPNDLVRQVAAERMSSDQQ